MAFFLGLPHNTSFYPIFIWVGLYHIPMKPKRNYYNSWQTPVAHYSLNVFNIRIDTVLMIYDNDNIIPYFNELQFMY